MHKFKTGKVFVINLIKGARVLPFRTCVVCVIQFIRVPLKNIRYVDTNIDVMTSRLTNINRRLKQLALRTDFIITIRYDDIHFILIKVDLLT